MNNEMKLDSVPEDDKTIPFRDLKAHEDFGKFPGERYDVLRGDIYQSGGNKDFIIRGVGAKSFWKESWSNDQELLDFAKKLKLDFIELEKVFGIRVATTTFVPAKTDTGFPELFEVTERIEGVTLKKLSRENFNGQEEEIKQMLFSHFDNLFSYVVAKFSKREKIFGDIYHNEQYVYGKNKKDKKDMIYLIDPDPNYIELDTLTETRFFTEYLRMILQLLGRMSEISKKLSVDFDEVKNKIKEKYFEIKDKIPEGERKPYHSMIEKAIEGLLGI